ncbi:MAG: hypothetical protein NT154_28135 [Verrucomicrobia bacterium]|nr:hypothetical protein [Verrucomicrobiota bacterium]
MKTGNDNWTSPGMPGSPQSCFVLDPPLPKEALRRVTALAELARKNWAVDGQLEPVMWSDRGLIQCAAMPANRAQIEGVKKYIRKERRNSQTTVVAQEIWIHPPSGPRLYDKEAILLTLYLPGRVVCWQTVIRRPVVEDFVLLSDSHSEAPGRLVFTELLTGESAGGTSMVPVDIGKVAQVLHINLISHSGESFGVGVGSWLCLLVIAQNYGWQPSGTLAPAGFVGEWNGTYRYNQGQRVSAEDAQGLAEALRRALPDLPRTTGSRLNPWPENSNTSAEGQGYGRTDFQFTAGRVGPLGRSDAQSPPFEIVVQTDVRMAGRLGRRHAEFLRA